MIWFSASRRTICPPGHFAFGALFDKDFWQTRPVERLGIHSITLSDGPHGVRKQAGSGDQLGLNPSLPATCFPTAATVASSWDPAMRDKAVELVKKADVVLLYIGLDEISESESLDRPHMKLPQSQIYLLEAVAAVNPNVVAILSAGSAVETPWLDKCKAVIHGYLCGQAGAGAMLQAITGEINICPLYATSIF